jgi:hypothetical protein
MRCGAERLNLNCFTVQSSSTGSDLTGSAVLSNLSTIITKRKRNITMANSNDDVYFVVRDEQGEELLCPVDLVRDKTSISENDLLDCFEKEVAERYSGNIIIQA